MKEPPMALIDPSLPKVCAAPAPLTTAQRITKIPQMKAALVKLTILLPTAVPNTLAASLAPSDQPRNKALERKIRISGSDNFQEIFLISGMRDDANATGF